MTHQGNPKSAFVLRMNPQGSQVVQAGLNSDEIISGWSDVDLSDQSLSWADFRQKLAQAYPAATSRTIGSWAGSLWRFVREMKVGDLVVVPVAGGFYVSEVKGPCTYNQNLLPRDTAHRRKCEWLNNKTPIDRNIASAALQLRMKARQTCVSASDLVDDIRLSLQAVSVGGAIGQHSLNFVADLRSSVINTLQSLKTRMNDRDFEILIEKLLKRLGASSTRIVGRKVDKGGDIIAQFKHLGLTLGVQAKYHPDKRWKTADFGLQQLLLWMEEQDADIGWFVTCGEFDFDVGEKIEELAEIGTTVRFIDGVELASLIVELGIGPD